MGFVFSFISSVYPKVKVRQQREEADQYVYEKSSLESLKAFEWLSLKNSSSSSVVRVPRVYIPMSPPPSFYASKDKMNKKETDGEEGRNGRANSAPRPRAVLSSPVNDCKFGRRTPPRREIASSTKDGESIKYTKSGSRTSSPRKIASVASVNDEKSGSRTPPRKVASSVKDGNSSQNKHTTQSKIFPRSKAADHLAPSQGHIKEATHALNSIHSKGRAMLSSTSLTAGHRTRTPIIPLPAWH